ncbi:bifunctional phosphopantothenoylcysteine decarboxylase/phosphopantothenate--cysteine ligase CoaBC [Vibrio ezurae]|uniref:Coenzyme A biosynthesis bifunctional protein CoaBC n=1 Tax=Vibrio ezurae NBRC 102218 TaxID=1219080 RepID=U3B4U8_9VIBR|nr:bifunctional phosphopantothenoylcysteine decarboxylase/phosphopantothenate--cysteine ligase CoaBC [Vibrio ezurae]GAD80965.1 phosphopantothenoylcysteine decarboxylase/phosphopantothenoylcysteine synthetase [Vibrio ezurae NBRC 102218]
MQPLEGKKIVLGISGGIAAYKCAELTRRLSERGAQVKVVMTRAAKEFITPLTMQAVSGHPVAESLLDPAAEASMGHIEIAKWADLVLLAPATADLIARMAAGMGNDLLSTFVLATDAPVAVSPAMNQQMYSNIATQENIATLRRRGMLIWGPASGEQACGDIGAGRMLEPMQLVDLCISHFQPKILQGKKIAITAGPTQEAIDPVRFISNHSSGKMGFALADQAAKLGAEVTLISGPVNLPTPSNVKRIDVLSAQQMHQAAVEQATEHDIFIGCAAVADYRAAEVAEQKMKKVAGTDELVIRMVKNPDIIATVASLSENRPFTVGFAAETQDVERYAMDKLTRKKLDLICANDVSQTGIGFNSNDNVVSLYWANGQQHFSLASKQTLAKNILEQINELTQ